MSEQDHESHPFYLAHHYKNMDQQTKAGKLGMWVFMGQEMLFFSGLFCAYGYMRFMYPEAVHQSQHAMSLLLGGVNSVLLLISSLTMSLCVRYVRLNETAQASRQLFFTMLLGFAFLCIKAFEWMTHMREGLYPGKFFHPLAELHMTNSLDHVFFGLYYVMTGMHAVHIVVGLGLMVWMMKRLTRGEFNSENYVALENSSLFWHFVDVVWIFLYPMLYLAV